MAGIKFEIVEHIGVISTQSTGWTRELNLVSWNDIPPKYDIRDWDAEHEHMSKGITLTEQELFNLLDIIGDYQASLVVGSQIPEEV